MSAQTQAKSSNRAVGWTILLGLSVLALCWVVAPAQPSTLVPLLFFGFLLFLAERLPVSVGEDGVQVTVSLPIVAAVATVYGPAAAGSVDFLATAVAGASFLGAKRLRSKWTWPLFNGAQSALSAAAAGFAAMPLAKAGQLGMLGGALVAVSAYVLVNAVSVAMIECVLTSTSFLARLDEKRKVIGVQYILYAVLSLAVVALLRKEMVAACVLLIVPMWAARQCFQLRARYDKDYRETIRALGLMMQHAHPYTGGHLDRVAQYAALTAQRLGLPQSDVDLMFDAAILHDLGKIAIDEEILNKPGRLNERELDEVRKHPVHGAEILARVRMLEPVVPWIAAHHERPDGTGYPLRLPDEQIPVQAKIIAVVDAFDAMVGGDGPGDHRPYRVSMSPSEAIRELHGCAGTQFDERVVMAFTQVVKGQEAA